MGEHSLREPGACKLCLIWFRLRRIAHHRGETVRAKSEPAVEFLRVAREQIDAATLEFRVVENAAEHPFAESFALMGVGNHDVAQVTDGGAIRHDTGNAHLLSLMIQAKAERVLEAGRDDGGRSAGAPISAMQQAADRPQVELRGVV
jgi:hypothetical protein